MLTTGGSGTVTVNGKSYVQHADSAVVIPASLPCTAVPGSEGWSVSWLTVRGSLSDTLVTKLGLENVSYAQDIDIQEALSLHEQIMTAADRTIPSPRIISTLLYAFILAVHEAISQKGAEKYNCSITESVRYIDSNYSTDISLERLAAISGVSLQHFCRVFRSKLGMRPMEYLARTRVAHAKILLGETDGRISDIAKSVGFDDQNYFGITFRKYEGISPTEYRKERGIREKNGG